MLTSVSAKEHEEKLRRRTVYKVDEESDANMEEFTEANFFDAFERELQMMSYEYSMSMSFMSMPPTKMTRNKPKSKDNKGKSGMMGSKGKGGMMGSGGMMGGSKGKGSSRKR